MSGTWAWSLAGAVLGAIIGSFLATILLRWPAGRSVVAGRSACDACHAPLAAVDLAPIVSFLRTRGRCRRCGAAIDRRHLGVELSAVMIGFAAFHAHSPQVALFSAIFGWWLLILAALDLEHFWLPDRLTLPLIPAGLAVGWIGIGSPLDERLIGAGAGFLTLAGIGLAYRKLRGRTGLGGGDPKLLAGLGAWLGWTQLPFVLLGAALLGLTALLVLRFGGRPLSATDRAPLGALMALIAWPLWLLAPVMLSS